MPRPNPKTEVRSREVLARAHYAEALRTLRKLTDKEAFHFYEDLGKPTGECARSLSSFLEIIESVKLESLLFHHERHDFRNWARNTLEDSKLAKRLEKMQFTPDFAFRAEIWLVVKNRLRELEATSDPTMICVVEPAHLTHKRP